MKLINKHKVWLIIVSVPLITFMLYRTGGYESWLSFLYIMPIAWASVAISIRAGLGMAIYTGVFYLAMVGLDLYEIIPHYSILPTNIGFFEERILMISISILLDKLLIFFVIASVIAYFVKTIKKEQEKLLQLEKMKSNFMSFCSHQLRAPLSNLKLYVDELLTNGRGKLPPESQESLGIMKNQVKRLIKMSDYFLDLATIHSDQFTDTVKPIKLDKLIAEIVKEHQEMAKKHGHKLVFDASKGEVKEVALDQLKIEQVINNLLQNSIKYLKKNNGEINVKLAGISNEELNRKIKNDWKEGAPLSEQLLEALSQLFPHVHSSNQGQKNENWFQITIRDNGIGIPESEQNRIFSETFRAQNAKSFEGSGMSLFLSKVLMQSLGGRICFESKEGEGTAFHVFIPAK